MKTDFSRLLYDKYFSITNRNIEVKMKNGVIIQGIIVGFIKGDEYSCDPYITKWHIVDTSDERSRGIDIFGFPSGTYIKHNDIVQVKFCQDNSIMIFK